MGPSIQLISLLVVAAVILALAQRQSGDGRLARWFPALALLGTGLVLMRLIERIAIGPRVQFNMTRTATSIGMARGYNILPGPEQGPVLDFMYGPVSAAAYLPVAWSPTPSGAVWIGIAMTFVFMLAPFAWLTFAHAHSRDGLFAILAHFLSLSVPRVATNGLIDVLSGNHHAFGYRTIATGNIAVLQRFCQSVMSHQSTGHKQ